MFDEFLWDYMINVWYPKNHDTPVIDPSVEKCNCGYSFTPTLFMKIIILIHGKFILHCPHCHSELELRMNYHIYMSRRKENMDTEIWKNG